MSLNFYEKIGLGITALLVSLCFFITAVAFADDSSRQRPERGHHNPPPEAYTACEGKNAGDAAEFTSPHGDTVTGTCEEVGEQLILRPDNPPERRGGGRGDRENDNLNS